MSRHPLGDRAMTPAERQARRRARLRGTQVRMVIRGRVLSQSDVGAVRLALTNMVSSLNAWGAEGTLAELRNDLCRIRELIG